MFGLDLLGLGSKYWKIKETISVFPQGWALGVFATTFGDALPNVRKLLQSGKVAALRVHIWWANDHKIVPLDVLKKELPRWEKLAQEFPDIHFYISHSCEYSESSISEIKKRVEMVKKICPSCVAVSTPMHSPVVKGTLLEQHGTAAKPKVGGIVSTDGQEIQQIDASKWVTIHKDADIVFLWGARFNLREAGTVPPPQDRKAAPSKEYIKGIIRLASPRGDIPTPTFPYLKLKKPELWKTFAEDGPGEGDKRANRPLAILKKKTDFIELVTHTGKVIGKLKYYGGFPPDLHRYYSGVKGAIGLYGYQIGLKALAESGSEWIWIKQGKTFYGPICAPFRTPFYQS